MLGMVTQRLAPMGPTSNIWKISKEAIRGESNFNRNKRVARVPSDLENLIYDGAEAVLLVIGDLFGWASRLLNSAIHYCRNRDFY